MELIHDELYQWVNNKWSYTDYWSKPNVIIAVAGLALQLAILSMGAKMKTWHGTIRDAIGTFGVAALNGVHCRLHRSVTREKFCTATPALHARLAEKGAGEPCRAVCFTPSQSTECDIDIDVGFPSWTGTVTEAVTRFGRAAIAGKTAISSDGARFLVFAHPDHVCLYIGAGRVCVDVKSESKSHKWLINSPTNRITILAPPLALAETPPPPTPTPTPTPTPAAGFTYTVDQALALYKDAPTAWVNTGCGFDVRVETDGQQSYRCQACSDVLGPVNTAVAAADLQNDHKDANHGPVCNECGGDAVTGHQRLCSVARHAAKVLTSAAIYRRTANDVVKNILGVDARAVAAVPSVDVTSADFDAMIKRQAKQGTTGYTASRHARTEAERVRRCPERNAFYGERDYDPAGRASCRNHASVFDHPAALGRPGDVGVTAPVSSAETAPKSPMADAFGRTVDLEDLICGDA